jgi:hypothetical protein
MTTPSDFEKDVMSRLKAIAKKIRELMARHRKLYPEWSRRCKETTNFEDSPYFQTSLEIQRCVREMSEIAMEAFGRYDELSTRCWQAIQSLPSFIETIHEQLRGDETALLRSEWKRLERARLRSEGFDKK